MANLPTAKAVEISTRLVAVFIATSLGAIGVGSIFGVGVWKSAAIAALLGCGMVGRSLAVAYLRDGSLSQADIDSAFKNVDTTPNSDPSQEIK